MTGLHSLTHDEYEAVTNELTMTNEKNPLLTNYADTEITWRWWCGDQCLHCVINVEQTLSTEYQTLFINSQAQRGNHGLRIMLVISIGYIL